MSYVFSHIVRHRGVCDLAYLKFIWSSKMEVYEQDKNLNIYHMQVKSAWTSSNEKQKETVELKKINELWHKVWIILLIFVLLSVKQKFRV